MKKLIAVSAVLALVAGSAFAEINVTGSVQAYTNLIQGDNDDDSDIQTSGDNHLVRLQASGEQETGVGTFGGWLRIQPGGMWGYTWWAPNDMIRLTLGEFPDSWWGRDGIARWGFYAMAQDILEPGYMWSDAFQGGAGYDLSFYGGFSRGLLLDITPMDMLEVRIGLRTLVPPRDTGDVFGDLVFQLGLNLDFGTIALTYDGAGLAGWALPWGRGGDTNGSIWAYAGITAIDGIGIDFGVGFHLLDDPIISVGLAADVGISPEFALRARLQATIDTIEAAPFGLMFELLPSFTFAPGMTGFLGAGLDLLIPDEGDASLGFYVFPYVRIGSTWGPSFYAGFELRSRSVGGADAAMTWRVPIGLYHNF